MKNLATSFIVFLCHLAMTPLLAQSHFDEVSKEWGINQAYGSGNHAGSASFYDFNNDGLDDISLATDKGEDMHFYLNENGTFIRIYYDGLSNLSETKQLLWGDFDNDGDADLFVTSREQNRLYENIGVGSFRDITSLTGIDTTVTFCYGATWGDYNRDGWLDLYVTNYDSKFSNRLYRNNWDHTFTDVTEETLATDASTNTFVACFIDTKNSGSQDIFIANDRSTGNSLLSNTDGSYTNISSEASVNIEMNSMCIALADYDKNGYQDIYVTNTWEGNILMRNEGNGRFTEVAEESNVSFNGIGWGANFFDFDNDTYSDLYVSGDYLGSFGVASALYKNDHEGGFIKIVDPGMIKDTVASFSNAIGDIDNDGYPDILVNNGFDFGAHLWKNKGGSKNWLKIKLIGVTSNIEGIGSLCEVFVGGLKASHYKLSSSGFMGQNSKYQHIGLNNVVLVDSIRVSWLSGHTDTFYDIASNQILELVEGSSNLLMLKWESNYGGNKVCDQQVIVLGSGLHSPLFRYQWSTGDTTATKAIKTSGSYSLSVFDQNEKLISSLDTTIIFEPPINFDYALVDISCFGLSNGQLILSSEEDLRFFLGDQEVFDTLDNLSSGYYEISALRNDGCQKDSVIFVGAPDEIKYEIFYQNNSIHITALGDTGPYEYYWDSSNTSSDSIIVSETSDRFHQFEIVDANQCSVLGAVDFNTIIITSNFKGLAKDTCISYPNPANNVLYLEGCDKSSTLFSIYDITGKVIISHHLRQPQIDVSGLAKGIYLLQIENLAEGSLHIDRFIKN